MSLPPLQVVPLSLLLLASPALAQPHSAKPPAAPRRLELPAPQGAAEVRVAPGVPTTLLFNARLDRGAVERAGRELGFARVAVGEDTLTVLPSGEVKPGTRPRLPLRFAEGSPREGEAVVFLVGEAADAEVSVEVWRGARTVAALEEALATEHARCTAQEAELAASRAEAGSLAALMAAGVLGEDGIPVVESPQKSLKPLEGVSLGKVRLYVANGRVAVAVELALAAGAPAWAPRRATLTRADGATIISARVVRFLGPAAPAPGERASLVVEFEVPTEELSMKYDLEVMEQAGQRPLKIYELSLAASAAQRQ